MVIDITTRKQTNKKYHLCFKYLIGAPEEETRETEEMQYLK
jgi:hypothetical protein